MSLSTGNCSSSRLSISHQCWENWAVQTKVLNLLFVSSLCTIWTWCSLLKTPDHQCHPLPQRRSSLLRGVTSAQGTLPSWAWEKESPPPHSLELALEERALEAECQNDVYLLHAPGDTQNCPWLRMEIKVTRRNLDIFLSVLSRLQN